MWKITSRCFLEKIGWKAVRILSSENDMHRIRVPFRSVKFNHQAPSWHSWQELIWSVYRYEFSVNVAESCLTLCNPMDYQIRSDQISHSVMSDSLRPHESQHARPPCPSPTPGVHSDSRPSSQWYHPAISSLSSPSPLAPYPSQHQSLFQWVNSSHEVAKVLEFQL